jgi:type I restriction enzyme M protein
MSAAFQEHLSFSIARSNLQNRVLIPKYYDPELAAANEAAKVEYELPLLADLLLPGNLGSRLGVWIRREHYGGGTIPYVRTSDLHNWRLRPDFKKGVAQDVFDSVATRQDVDVSDILMVAHGTYLVGTVAIVTEEDLPLVLQDHIFRLRLRRNISGFNGRPVDAWLLLAALSTRFTRRQIRARQFSADIIDKVGNRHYPCPVSAGSLNVLETRLASR